IIQEMINPKYSGVVFTTNPLTNNPDELLINTVYGLGEQLVSGEEDSDIYIIDDKNKILFQKPYSESGLCMDEKDIIKLKQIALEIESIYKPRLSQDIEFCVNDENEIYILQSRPISTYSHIDKSLKKTILDNSNIVESYSSIVTPLTFSFASHLYTNVYKQVSTIVNKDKESLKKFENIFNNMISIYDSRVYYNLNNWYSILQLLPFYELNRGYMENMMGVKVQTNIVKNNNNIGFKYKIKESKNALRVLSIIVWYYITIKSKSKKFIDKFDDVTKEYRKCEFNGMSIENLAEIYDDLNDKILGNWKIPIVNDCFTMLFYGILTKKINSLGLDDIESIQNDLLCGQGDVYSTKPILGIIDLAKYIKQDPILYDIFKNNEVNEIQDILNDETNENYMGINKKIKMYINDFGCRTMNEQQLEQPTMKDDPNILFLYLKNYVNLDLDSLSFDNGRDIEKEILSKTKGIEKIFTKKLIKLTKYFVKNREHLRFKRTEAFAIVKGIFKEIGVCFEEMGYITESNDIFYLDIKEVFELAEGRSVDQKIIKKVIEHRKQQYVLDSKKATVERLCFFGGIYQGNCLEIFSVNEVLKDNSDIDKGVPCSPGEVIGKVQIIKNPNVDEIYGDILVAERTDPGWVPLFSLFKGIVIERGSVLSHSAVIARELGVPTIVGYRGISTKLYDGQLIKMNGSDGTIELLEENNS
ncbi:MAG: hypothetical protein IJH34_14820, partial [Romboutsia sp.]|nr:hypothetical protein [Romboutsia sp.]